MWETVDKNFMKADKPYGPGDFRIRHDAVVSMKLSFPETRIKPKPPEQLASSNLVAEYTEAWMYSSTEKINRQTVRILGGTVANAATRHMEERAQNADWWLAPDWSTMFLATDWVDAYQARNPEELAPHIAKLYTSSDQGKSWTRLSWPESFNISFLRFLDAQRGYAIGWGPRIWRTADGGGSWTEIPVPDAARHPADVRKQFDAVVLGNDGVLRVAFATHESTSGGLVSQVHALRWDASAPSLAYTLPSYTVADLADHLGHLYVLAWNGQPSGDDSLPLSTSVFYAGQQGLELRHEFAPGFKAYALYITPSGGLLADGIDEQSRRPEDLTAVSYDAGKSWKLQTEGASAQGGYYDAQTGTRWRVVGYSLYKRHIP